jgi:Ca2+-binding EF-hand superfamily protein
MGSACSSTGSPRIDKSQLPKGTIIDPGCLDQPDFGSVPSSAHLSKLFEQFAHVKKTFLNLEELTTLMKATRRMYESRKPEMSKKLNVPTYDKKFYSLVLYALDDDSSNTVEVNEWKRWITRGASMDTTKREKWASKDINNMRLDFFLRSVLDACGASVDTQEQPSFDSW